MRGLYAIADVGTLIARGLDPLRFAEAILRARPAALQLRDKRGDPRATLALLRAIAPLAKQTGVPFYANDRADLALLGGCSGLHVGQEDLPPDMARRLDDRLSVGMSVHNDRELERALTQRPDYIALGPVFATRSKANPDPPLGIEGLSALAASARAAGKPLVAIGGIDAESAPEIRRHCDAGAVISALIDEHAVDPYERAAAIAAELHRLLCNGALGGMT